LPEAVQIVVGAIVLLIGLFGMFLFWASQVAIGGSNLAAILIGFAGSILGFLASVVAGIASLGAGVVLAIVLLIAAILFNIDGFIKLVVDTLVGFFITLGMLIAGAGQILIGLFMMILGAIFGIFTGNWDMLTKGWKMFFDGIITFIIGAFNLIVLTAVNFGIGFLNALVTGFSNAFKFVTDLIKKFIPELDPLFQVLGSLWKIISDVSGFLSSGMGNATSFINGMIPGFAEGGIVTRPTLAMIGENGPEAVVPLNGGSSFSTSNSVVAPTINIYATLSSDLDVRNIATEVSRILIDDYRRV
jgi:hypothetical protein